MSTMSRKPVRNSSAVLGWAWSGPLSRSPVAGISVSPPDLRAPVVDRARPQSALIIAHLDTPFRSARERVHHGLDRDDSLRPLDDRLLGAVFDGGDAVRRGLRPLSPAQDRLGRARGVVDPALAEADGLCVH